MTYIAYAQSLAWIALFWAVAIGVCVVVTIYYADFVYHSSHRTRENALDTMRLMPLVMGIIAVIGAFLVFTLPQIFQATVADLSLRYGRRPEPFALLALPLTVAIAWYSYDYLTPSNVDLWADHVHEHGISLQRYATMFAIQAPISLFAICYHHAAVRRARKAWFVLALLVAVIGAGGIWGYEVAKIPHHYFKTQHGNRPGGLR